MTDDRNIPQDETKHYGSGPLYEVSRRILLAAIGAISYAQDEVEEFVNRLVERGEIAEKEGKQLLNELREKRADRKHDLEATSRKRMHELLERMNIPNKDEIEDLSKRVEALTKKVEELIKKE